MRMLRLPSGTYLNMDLVTEVRSSRINERDGKTTPCVHVYFETPTLASGLKLIGTDGDALNTWISHNSEAAYQ